MDAECLTAHQHGAAVRCQVLRQREYLGGLVARMDALASRRLSQCAWLGTRLSTYSHCPERRGASCAVPGSLRAVGADPSAAGRAGYVDGAPAVVLEGGKGGSRGDRGREDDVDAIR